MHEADRYCTAILAAQPKHPDANHNISVLTIGIGKVQVALAFFKTALEANPNTARFWLSYIDALIKLDRVDDARAVFGQAKSHDAKGDGYDKLEERLKVSSVDAAELTKNENSGQTKILEVFTPDQEIKLSAKKYNEKSKGKFGESYQNILDTFPKIKN